MDPTSDINNIPIVSGMSTGMIDGLVSGITNMGQLDVMFYITIGLGILVVIVSIVSVMEIMAQSRAKRLNYA